MSELTQLRQLCLSDVPIPSEDKVKWLRHNIDLASLWLNNTGVGDPIVPILKFSPKLELLSVANTKVSVAGCKQLQAIPTMKIFLPNAAEE